jgi:hypothetical protein
MRFIFSWRLASPSQLKINDKKLTSLYIVLKSFPSIANWTPMFFDLILFCQKNIIPFYNFLPKMDSF